MFDNIQIPEPIRAMINTGILKEDFVERDPYPIYVVVGKDIDISVDFEQPSLREVADEPHLKIWKRLPDPKKRKPYIPEQVFGTDDETAFVEKLKSLI